MLCWCIQTYGLQSLFWPQKKGPVWLELSHDRHHYSSASPCHSAEWIIWWQGMLSPLAESCNLYGVCVSSGLPSCSPSQRLSHSRTRVLASIKRWVVTSHPSCIIISSANARLLYPKCEMKTKIPDRLIHRLFWQTWAQKFEQWLGVECCKGLISQISGTKSANSTHADLV